MKRRRIWLKLLLCLVVLLCIISFGVIISPDNNNYDMTIAVISLDVALLALYISLRTFFSIDEVNAISRMDGNVMENPRYHPNILRAVFNFPQSDFKETSDAIMTHLSGLFSDKNQQSGAHLADNVQEVADLLVLIPYFIKDETVMNRQQATSILETMRFKVDNFKEISDGSCKLLEETVSLIDAVFAYQKMTSKEESGPTKLLEIRGSLFINPVSRILYNDYLGLYYFRRATNILSEKISPSLGELIAFAKDKSDEEKSMALVYCNKAIESFIQAKENIDKDMIWTGYICFNIARAEYLKQFLKESFGETYGNEWESHINESIRSWMTSNKMIAEHFPSNKRNPDGKPSWLQRAFISEEYFVRLTKVVMQILRKEPLTDFNGNAWLKNYNEIQTSAFYQDIPNPDPLKLTVAPLKDIQDLLKL